MLIKDLFIAAYWPSGKLEQCYMHLWW